MTVQEQTEIKFNLNWYIKVKLTDAGFKHWKQVDDRMYATLSKSLRDEHTKPIEHYKTKQDADGYVKMQAWEFMQYFGETIVFGTVPVFSPDIILLPDYLATTPQNQP